MFVLLLCELLDPTSADLELLGNDIPAHPMVNNSLTYPVDTIPLELHFARTIVGQIMPTKSFADNTDGNANNSPVISF